MKKIYLILAVVLTASCSPRVVTNISQLLPPLNPDEPVRVVNNGSSPPSNGLYVGYVRVSDSGASIGCSYEQVVEMARLAALKSGGNLLYIDEHRWPDFVSTCHQIVASIYRVDGPADIVAREENSEGPVLSEYAPAPELADNVPQSGINQYYASPRTGNMEIVQPGYMFNKWRVAVDVAYSYIYPELSDGMPTDRVSLEFAKKLRNGISYGISMTSFTGGNNVGWGAKFAGNHYSHTMYTVSDKVNTFYFGPEFISRIPTINHRNAWIFSLSVGCVIYNEKVINTFTELKYTKPGFKSTAEIGYDIRLDGNVFLGLKVAANLALVRYKIGNVNEMNNFSAIEIGGGLRF